VKSKRKDIENRIIIEAKKAFVKNGYSKVNTQFLANELGISKRTLYEYFKSKESLLEEVIDSDLKEIKYHIDSIVKEIKEQESEYLFNLNRLWNVMSKSSYTFTKKFYDDLKRFAPKQWKKIEKFRADQIKRNFTKLYAIGVKRGIIKDNINKEIFYLIYYNSLQNILVPDILSDLPITNLEALQNIIDVLFTGSLTEKGREDYKKIDCK